MNYRALIGGIIIACGFFSTISAATAQEIDQFEAVSSDDSPMGFRTDTPLKTVFLRQYRPNTTVFVGRWFHTPQSTANASGSLPFIEAVLSNSAPGFRFSAEIQPEQLLTMFQNLKQAAQKNGADFNQTTRYGPIAMTPFMRNKTQCFTFVAHWGAQTEKERGSRILGYYCDEGSTSPDPLSDGQKINMIDAQQMAASFFWPLRHYPAQRHRKTRN